MILLSKLIKSNDLKHPKPVEKRIKLRTVELPVRRDELLSEQNEGLNQSQDSVQYKEQISTVHSEKEDLDRLKQAFQVELDEWHIEQEKEKQRTELEAELTFNQSAEEGYNKGYQEGLEQGKQKYTSLVDQAKETVELSKTDYHNKLTESTQVMLELAFTIARKIVGDALEKDDSAWLTLVKEAVTEIREQEEVKIYIHPSWYETTLQQKKELQGIALRTRELLIFPDDSLNENDCLIETPYGQIDASVDSQLRELKRVLVEKMKEGEKHEYS